MKNPKNTVSTGSFLCENQSQTVAEAEAPFALRVDFSDSIRPVLGHHECRPSLSWKLPASCLSQTACQIVVASNLQRLHEEPDIWDSGKVDSAQSTFLPWGAKPLSSRQHVFWCVRVWDQDGVATGWSDPAEFELGLLHNHDWSAQWISSPCVQSGEHRPAPHLRRTFKIDQPITKARLHATALGLFELRLNGARIAPGEAMLPGWTDYGQRLHALTYDVTEHLTGGDNVIGAILGDGWYYGMGKQIALVRDGDMGIYGDTLELLLQLEITCADGATVCINSDGQWKTHDGPIRESSIYNGEIYDARHEMPGWSELGFDDTKWLPVTARPRDDAFVIEPKPMPSTCRIQELTTVAVTEPAPGIFIFDLGQNIVGQVRIQVPARREREITVRFAEMLNDDGTLYTENYRCARSTDHVIPATDGELTWEPTFTFHGFRYVELSGLADGVGPRPDFVTGIVLHTYMPPTGEFVSSHAKLNRLQSNIVWGQKGNFLEVPTDCPQRDERLGWTGDAQVFCATSCFNFETLAFWRKWLIDLADAQREDGALPHIAPDLMTLMRKKHGDPMKDYAAAGWADAGVIVPWEVYVRYGDRRILEEFYPMMARWVDFCATKANDFILKQALFGDWLQPHSLSFDPSNPVRSLNGDTPEELISTAYFGRVSDVLGTIAALLGKNDDAERYHTLRDQVREAFTARFFFDDGRLSVPIPTQAGYLMALGFDMLPVHLRAAAAKHLVQLVHDADDHLRTGFLGTPLLCPVLDRFGYTDLAYTVLMKETYPSWFYSINQGATTMWERWNSYSKADGFGSPRMNSFNHYAYGAIGQWMYERVAGLAPDPQSPGYKHFFVRPVPGGGLTHASVVLETPYGLAASKWTINGKSFEISITVPPNATATVILPYGQTNPRHIASGEHHLSCQLP